MEETIQEIRKWFANSRGDETVGLPLKTVSEEYPAWVIRMSDGQFGVAIPYDGKEISEDFNEVSFQSENMILNGQDKNLLMLLSENETSREQFAVFCYSLVDPGENGKYRKSIEKNPAQWWKDWKELVGNSSVEKKPYAVIGELITLRRLLQNGFKASWGGPDGATKDIETPYFEVEVKSTTSRYEKKVNIHGQFQLDRGNNPLYLMFNRFEKRRDGESINSVVADLVDHYEVPKQVLEKKLRKEGYKAGKSSRNETYALLEQELFPVNSSFPLITNSSFCDGQLPKGIESLSYTVNLAVCEPVDFNTLDELREKTR